MKVGAEILTFRNSFAHNEILRIATPKPALEIPTAKYAMFNAVPIMAFFVHSSVVVIPPSFIAVALFITDFAFFR